MAIKYFIISVATSIEGGAEVVLKNLLESYEHTDEIALVAPECSGLREVLEMRKIKQIVLPTKKDKATSNFVGLIKVLNQFPRNGLVHAWTRRSFELAAVAGIVRGMRVSATLHDHPDAHCIGRVRKFVMDLSVAKIKPVVCVSEHLRKALIGRRLGKNAVVIRNGVSDFGMARLHREGRKVRIGFAGMHHALKGFPTVADWIRQLLTSNFDVEFDLFGGLNPNWVSLTQSLLGSFPGKVRLRGRVSTEVLFQDIDVLVQVSFPFVETFGMVLAEAACAGIPVVTSAHGAEGEVVVDGKSGYVFPAQRPDIGLQRLKELITNRDTRLTMGEYARTRFENCFEARVMAERYREIWSECISNSNKEADA